MAHWAHITNGVVDNVIVIDAETLATGHWGDPSEWVQCSYRTQGGQHPEGKPLRKNYPGKSYLYDGIGFAPPQPYPSWTKDPDTYLWNPPTPMPTDGKQYVWKEETLSWEEVVI